MPHRGLKESTYRFEVTAVAKAKGAVPVRLRYWSVREALSVERAYHNMGYKTSIRPLHNAA